jgi:exodeoxyribonuclease V alpha subunit
MSAKHGQLFHLFEKLLERQLLKQIDIAFSSWMMGQLPESSDTQLFLSALVSAQLGEGHVCIELKDVSLIIEHWPKALRSHAQQYMPINTSNEEVDQFKDLLDYKIIGDGQSITPLVLDNNRLYLYRYWIYECQVARKLLKSDPDLVVLPEKVLTEQLDKYFKSNEHPDWQRIAAALTTRHKISVISGGPGTGKTTTVTKLLAIYIESQLRLKRRPIIQLAAPTGKAAARLSESIALAKSQLQLSQAVIDLIPEQGKTLHRLLGSRFNSKKFIHNQDNPLLLDLLVVDEASMIDLPMMASVMNALSSQTRLILIGDKDQLASVEAGSVLGDICALPQLTCYSQDQSAYLNVTCGFDHAVISKYPFSDQVAFLRKSYRFSAQSGIGALATACNQGDVKKIDQIFEQDFSDLNLIVPTQQEGQLLEKILSGYQSYLSLIVNQKASVQELIEAFNQFQVLCALRVGDYGIEKVNLLIEQQLERLNVKELDNRWYVGRPVMVTRNDNQMLLYNGDIGITAYDEVTGQLKVWFEQSGAIRGVLPSRLPQHETVFAMTVHKSQGSEFSHVMLLLAQSAKVINRELIYTAITRAKLKFSYFGLVMILKQAIEQKTKRVSGLADKIWFTL